MSALFHSLVALTYIALGAAAAFGLPLLGTAIEPVLALFAGAAVLIVGALTHQSIVHGSRGRDIMRELGIVASTGEAMQRDLQAARSELREIKTNISAATPGGSSGIELEENTRSSKEVLGELRLLRTLFSQLTSKKGAKKATAQAPAKTPEKNATRQNAPVSAPVAAAENTDDPTRLEPALDKPEETDAKSEYRASYTGLSSTLQHGDDAMDAPFLSGNNKIITKPSVVGSNAQDILAITRDALERARVSLFLQPIVSLPTRNVEFYEAYSRIQDHDGNFIGPNQYLDLAERAGLVGAIDNNLLFRCVQLLRRVRRHNREYGFFCNVSPHTLRDETFFGQFIEFLSENVELANDLIFEFSQTDVETHYNEFAENLDRLSELGFSFSIDRIERLDLNFSEIAKRNFHYIKVEAANLISLAGTERGRDQILNMQEDLLDSRVTMIVEKIETEPQLVELLDHNIRYGQGYLFGEPRESKA
jgi:cyclic-di-GMP phosphodiesterase TipF (flagellum assembly factor)